MKIVKRKGLADKTYHRTTLYIDYEYFKILKDIGMKQEKSLTELIDEAIGEYLKSRGYKV